MNAGNENSLDNLNNPNINVQKPLTKEELEFLPAALEIIESPPSPAGRILVRLLIALFVIAIVWSILGRLDEVAVASGRVIPIGSTRIVQAEDRGIISSILVQNGSVVREGDILIELDTTMAEIDIAGLTRERSHYTLMLRRLEAEARSHPFDITGLEWTDRYDIERHREFHARRVEDHANLVAVMEKTIQQARESLIQAQIMRDRLQMQVNMASEREERVRLVAERGGISEFTWQEYLERYLSLRKDLLGQESVISQDSQRLAQAQSELRRINEEREKTISEQIVDASHRLRLIENELQRAQERHRLTQIRSPIDGTVQQLMFNTLGGVVTGAEKLMQVVPLDLGFQFEVWGLNRDISFLYEGQRAEVKVEAFSFQRYGTLDATVEMVATEAVENEVHGLVYRVILSPDRDYFIIGDRRASLLPGMSVTAEIKTRRKRVIEFFLDPFRTHIREGLRER